MGVLSASTKIVDRASSDISGEVPLSLWLSRACYLTPGTPGKQSRFAVIVKTVMQVRAKTSINELLRTDALIREFAAELIRCPSVTPADAGI